MSNHVSYGGGGRRGRRVMMEGLGDRGEVVEGYSEGST